MTIAARPTTYNGIQMRSRLEARFAAFLDRAGLEWEYEPRAFASRTGQYLPDFLVHELGPVKRVYVEVIKESEPEAALAFLIAADAEENDTYWARLAIPGISHWAVGGLAVCGCSQPRFFLRTHVFLSDEELAGLDDDFDDPAIALCECDTPKVVSYLNPFAL